MDNLTHTLIGATTAKALPAKFQKPALYWALVIGNNLPDSDFIYSLLPGISPLDYLVHHRGYTHSVFFAVLLAPIGGYLASKLARVKLDREICLFTLLGCFMHISADYLNNYGVHPFSPFFNQWFYGDSVFIAEPLIWALLIPALVFVAHRKSARVFWACVGAVAFGVVWTTGYLDLNLKIFVTLLSLGSLAFHRANPRARAAFAGLILIIAMFRGASFVAKSRFRQSILPKVALDLSTTPGPGNPFCWSAWILVEENLQYETSKKSLSLLPAVYPNEKCSAVSLSREAQKVSILGKQEFEETYAHSCKLQRLMSFVRFPFLTRVGDKSYLAGDLRYAFPARGNFTETQIDDVQSGTSCGWNSVPWDSPFISSLASPR